MEAVNYPLPTKLVFFSLSVTTKFYDTRYIHSTVYKQRINRKIYQHIHVVQPKMFYFVYVNNAFMSALCSSRGALHHRMTSSVCVYVRQNYQAPWCNDMRQHILQPKYRENLAEFNTIDGFEILPYANFYVVLRTKSQFPAFTPKYETFPIDLGTVTSTNVPNKSQ